MNQKRNVPIKLSMSECYIAGVVGAMRRVASRQNGNDKNKHADKSDWATDADGALAEMAFARHRNVYWEPRVSTHDQPNYKHPDVDGFQVRSTTSEPCHLIIRKNDKVDDEIFILVITDVPFCKLVGSFRCGDAKTQEFWRSDKQSWWVPQSRLNDLP